jgi:hypothetical protein
MTDRELDALAEATYMPTLAASGLLAWVDAACCWQMLRREGQDYELQPPEGAIPPEQDAFSIGALIALRREIAQESPAVCALFDALMELLSGGERKH